MLARRACMSARLAGLRVRPLRQTRLLAGSRAPVTYFQEPAPSFTQHRRFRWFRAVLYVIIIPTVGLTGYLAGVLSVVVKLKDSAETVQASLVTLDEDEDNIEGAREGQRIAETLSPTGLSYKKATGLLMRDTACAASSESIVHICRVASNTPCEDHYSLHQDHYFGDPQRDWILLGIYDGHAGATLAYKLRRDLAQWTMKNLYLEGVRDRLYTPMDAATISAIERIWKRFDDMLFEDGLEFFADPKVHRAAKTAQMPLIDEGSCAIMAMYDPANLVLRVVNTGDSRAVLGRWSPKEGRYIAMPLSNPHTGFNEDEIRRLEQQHPGEDVIDKSTGRLFGLAVTRAFGDSRWKLPNALLDEFHEQFFANAPRPNGVSKTPPYLTAQPEVTETQLQLGEKPDFLIVASDGLWDQLSADQAVDLVERWSRRYEPQDFVRSRIAPAQLSVLKPAELKEIQQQAAAESNEHGLYYDASEKTLRWRNDPEFYTIEDDCAAAHLVRNALGGNRKDLFTTVMSVPRARSRTVRDDVTVGVMFFGPDISKIEPWLEEDAAIQTAATAEVRESANVNPPEGG